MNLVLAEKELYQSCEVIFGSDLDLSRDFLEYLQLSGVKSAYRKRALETHPDRFVACADADAIEKSGVLFHDVHRAYETLVSYLQAREDGVCLLVPPEMEQSGRGCSGQDDNSACKAEKRQNGNKNKHNAARGQAFRNGNAGGFNGFCNPGANGGAANSGMRGSRFGASPGAGASDFRGAYSESYRGAGGTRGADSFRQYRADAGSGFTNDGLNGRAKHADHSETVFCSLGELYRGRIPERPLLFGHFLYYSGVATWRNVVQALLWQRGQRPKIGEISRRYGILDEEAISMVLRYNSPRNPFGEAAVRLGLIDENQLQMLINMQKRLQRKFGEYFVEHDILCPEQLQQLVREYHLHNTRFSRSHG